MTDDIRARHVKSDERWANLCVACSKEWPCDTARVLDALDKERNHYDDPFGVWQGVCGHLWRKARDGEDCPRCAALARADKAEAALDAHDKRGIAALQDAVHARITAEQARDAARALADELAKELDRATRGHYEAHHDSPHEDGRFVYEGTCEECGATWPCEMYALRAALAKWEASRAK